MPDYTVRIVGSLIIGISITGCGIDMDTYDPAYTREDLLSSSAKTWNDSFLTGSPQEVYNLLSERCMSVISFQEFPSLVEDFGVGGPGPSSLTVRTDGDRGYVTTKFSAHPEKDTIDVPWVYSKEHGWRNDDC